MYITIYLAGSKRLQRTAAVAEQVEEGISISANAGLNALGNIILALVDPRKSNTANHIPYQDRKLIQLIQDSLGGNAQALMVACVLPTGRDSEHNQDQNIKNWAQVNAQEVGREDVEYLQSTINKLRQE
ncbi:hypothetical protein PtB15_4B607 [Puccinia triticina]|nr:hypothetical protein PtB15_4B607 [Puccinia triticina]